MKSQDPVKMNVFLEFLFDPDTLRSELYEAWCLVYEDNYVEQILDGLDEKRDKLARTLASIIERAVGKGSAGETKLSTKLSTFKKEEPKKFEPTKPAPFNLSQPKPRAIPEPVKIEKKFKANPVPTQNLYGKSLKAIEEEKAKRKEAIKAKVEEDFKNLVKPFELVTETRPSNLEKLKAEAEAKMKEMLGFGMTFAKEVPDFGEVPIKLNTAAIMKEAVAIQQRKAEIEQEQREVELNNRDSRDFETWKERGKRQDREEELRRQMERKIEMELAHEAAKKAIEDKEEEKRKNVEKMKEEKQKDFKKKEKMMATELERKTIIKKEVHEVRTKVTKVKQHLVKEKASAAEEQKEKLKIEIELRKLEEKKQQEIRDQLILKIRELDRKVIKKTKEFDPAEHTSQGLLEEMSLVQLQQKHKEMKEQFQRQEQERREQIKTQKHIKNQQVMEMMEMINDARNNRARANQSKRMATKEKLDNREKRKAKESQDQMVQGYHKIMDKKEKLKQEDAEITRIAKEIRLKKLYMKADQDKVEEQAWKNLEDGAEREAMERQNRKLIEQENTQSVKLKERELMAENAMKEFQETLNRQREYNMRADQEERDKELLNRMLRENQLEVVNTIKDFKRSHSKNILEAKPYEHKISMLSRSGKILEPDAFAKS